MVTENERFVWQFFSSQSHLKPYPFNFTPERKPNTVRIFILGESAALGTPEPAFGFGRALDRILKHRYPDRPVEVINLAMRGINSHMIRVIARECVQFDPSLVVFYGGNNEWVGWQAPGPDSSGTQSLAWIRFQQFLRASKSGQFIRSLVSSFRGNIETKQDMAFFHDHRLHPDDPRREGVLNRYSENLKDTFDALTESNVPVLVGSVVVNERDCPPLGSLHPFGMSDDARSDFDAIWNQALNAEARDDLISAINFLKKAMEIDARFAKLHFRLARLYERTEDLTSSRFHYRQAKDCDALPFRASSAINVTLKQAVESVASTSIHFVDLESYLRNHPSSMNQVPGGAFFYEHVHFRFNGDYTMASYLFPHIQQILNLPRMEPGEESVRLLELVDCAKELGYNPVLEAMMIQSMIQLQKGPPFLDQVDHSAQMEAMEKNFQQRFGGFGSAHFQGAINWIKDAMESHPQDWNLPFLAARIAARLKDFENAIALTTVARDLMPHASLIRMTLVHYLVQAGQVDLARTELEHVLKLYPEHQEALAALSAL